MDGYDNSTFLATGPTLLRLARKLERVGETEKARTLYLKAVEQGLLIRQLKEIFENGYCKSIKASDVLLN